MLTLYMQQLKKFLLFYINKRKIKINFRKLLKLKRN